MKIEIIISIICALAATFKWVYEYSEKSKWERNAFLLNQIEKFRSLETTRIMEKLLDWNSIEVKIGENKILVDDKFLIDSLQTHNIKHSFTRDEAKLREIFDDYFDNITKLIFMAEVGLVDKNNLSIFLGYWFRIISGESKNKPVEFFDKLHHYLEYYGYNDLIDFLENYKNK
jgi:hypothetical protein